MSKYKVGDIVEVRDTYGTGKWRNAVVTALAPYRGQSGYYILWCKQPYSEEDRRKSDLPMPSSGGWAYEAVMRQPLESTNDNPP